MSRAVILYGTEFAFVLSLLYVLPEQNHVYEIATLS